MTAPTIRVVGPAGGGSVTTDSTPTIEMEATNPFDAVEGSTIRLKEDSVLVATTQADANGDAAATLVYRPNGTRSYTADMDANVRASSVFSFTVEDVGKQTGAAVGLIGNSVHAASGIRDVMDGLLHGCQGRARMLSTGRVNVAGWSLADYQTWIHLVIAQRPDIIVIGNLINTLKESTAFWATTVKPAYDTLIDTIKAGSPESYLLIENCPVWGIVAGDSTRLAEINAANAAMAAWDAAGTYRGMRVAVADIHGVYDWTTMSWDNLHPNARGAQVWGDELAATALRLIQDLDDIEPGSIIDGQIWHNPTMAGTSGIIDAGSPGGTGVVAGDGTDNWHADNDTGATMVCAKGANGEQVLTLSGTTNNTAGDFRLYRAVIIPSMDPGDVHGGVVELDITAADGVSDPVGVGAFGIICGKAQAYGSTIDAANGEMPFKRTGLWRLRPGIVDDPATPTGAVSGSVTVHCTDGTDRDVMLTIRSMQLRKTETTARTQPIFVDEINMAGAGLVKPSPAGTAQVGQTLRARPGRVGGCGLTHAWQWQRSADGTTWTNISGATAITYVVQAGDEGYYLRYERLPTNALGSPSNPSHRFSNPTSAVVAA